MTIDFARGSDGAANEATKTWALTLFGTSTDKLTSELNVPSGETAATGTAFTGFSVDQMGLTVPSPNNIPAVGLLKNPSEQGVYRWAAEEHSSIDPVIGDTLFFNDLPGGQGVLIKGDPSAAPTPEPTPTPGPAEELSSDTTAPLVIAPPDLRVAADSESGTPVINPAIAAFLATAIAVDDVDELVLVTNDAPSIFPIGDTIVTFSATDAANNIGTATATVTVDPVPAASSSGIITTVAGTGVDGFSGNSGPATSAQLNFPIGVVTDSIGNLFISDLENDRIRRVDASTGIITTYAGGGIVIPTSFDDGILATSAVLSNPQKLAIDTSDNLYIADKGTKRVRRVDAITGIITTVAGTYGPGIDADNIQAITAELHDISGLAVNAGGDVFIAQWGPGKVRKVDFATGIITKVAGIGVAGNPLGDGGLAINASLDRPASLAFDSLGNLYIADAGNSRIRRVDASTQLISTFAGGGSSFADNVLATATTLNFAIGIAIDDSDNMFIADRMHQRIRRVDSATNLIVTIAGTGTAGFFGDGGPATAATINHPWEVDVDNSGNLFIADLSNHRVRKVTFSAPVVLESLTIAPATASIATGLTRQFTATGNFSDSTSQDLTSSVTWSSNNEPVATIVAGGLATGVAAGTATITATSDGIDGSATLNVTEPVVLESITIAPATASIAAGLTHQFSATGNFSDSSTQDLTSSVGWSSNNEPVATVAAGGLATGVADGTATITATLFGIDGTAALNVAALATCGDTLTTHATLNADLDCTGTTGTVFTIAADGVVFDGQGHKVLAPSATIMVSSIGNSDVSILNMDISGNAGEGIKISGGSGNLVSGVNASWSGATATGIGIHLENSNNNVIQNVTAIKRNIGIWLTGTSGGNTIRDNNLSGNNFAINAVQVGQGNSYLNNDLSDTTTWALTVYDDDAVQISGNDYTLASNAIFLSGVDGVTIDGENLAWTGATGAGGMGLEMQNSTNNIVQNVTSSNRNIGVRLLGTSGGNTIQNNTLTGNNVGIQATQLGQGNSYLNNDLSGSITWAITVWDDDSVQISGNDYTLAVNGIFLGGIDGVTIDGENLAWTGLAGAGGIGLEMQNSNNNIVQNVTATNRNIGFRLTGTSGGNTIQNNNFSGNNFAIHASQLGQGNSYLNNDLSNTTTWAITVWNDDSVQISGNDYTLAVNGIMLGEVDSVTLDGENLAWTGAAGAGGIGLELQNSDGNTIQNLVSTNRSMGVRLTGTSSGNTIQNNDLSGDVWGIHPVVPGSANIYVNNTL